MPAAYKGAADLADSPFPRRIPDLPPHPIHCFSGKSNEPPSPRRGRLRFAEALSIRPQLEHRGWHEPAGFPKERLRPLSRGRRSFGIRDNASCSAASPEQGKVAKTIFTENRFRRMRSNIAYPPPHTRSLSADAHPQPIRQHIPAAQPPTHTRSLSANTPPQRLPPTHTRSLPQPHAKIPGLPLAVRGFRMSNQFRWLWIGAGIRPPR